MPIHVRLKAYTGCIKNVGPWAWKFKLVAICCVNLTAPDAWNSQKPKVLYVYMEVLIRYYLFPMCTKPCIFAYDWFVAFRAVKLIQQIAANLHFGRFNFLYTLYTKLQSRSISNLLNIRLFEISRYTISECKDVRTIT